MQKSFYLLSVITQRFLHTGKIAIIVIHLNPALYRWVKNTPFGNAFHIYGNESLCHLFRKKTFLHSLTVTQIQQESEIWNKRCSFSTTCENSAIGIFVKKYVCAIVLYKN